MRIWRSDGRIHAEEGGMVATVEGPAGERRVRVHGEPRRLTVGQLLALELVRSIDRQEEVWQ